MSYTGQFSLPRSRLKAAVRSFLERRFPLGWRGVSLARDHLNRLVARFTRNRCKTYVGITGSCGKSTTAYLTGLLLADVGSVHSALQSNAPGPVYLSLAGLRRRVDFFVQEISGDKPGRLARVTRIVRPDIAVVTAVGLDHNANFKEQASNLPGELRAEDRFLQVIAEEKGTLVASLGTHGVACLDADKPLVRAMAARTRARVILFGTSPDAEVRAENVTAVWPGRLAFDLIVDGDRRRVQTRFVGTLLLGSILAALSVVRAVGGDLGRAVERLAAIEPFHLRMNVEPGRDGHNYVLDTNKAPLWQTSLLIEDLPNLRAPSLVFVLGEVSDSRNDKSRQHRKLLRRASEVADHVVGFGEAARSAHKVRAEGVDNVVGLETYDQAVAYLATLPPSVVILKSNKLTRMERIWEAVAPPSSPRT